MSKYRLILSEKANFEVTMMCRLLEVARSAYYAWVGRPASARAVRAAALAARIAVLHEDSDGTYGAPRILADLRAEGEVVSAKTVAKSMRANGLRGCAPPQWRTTTEPEPDPANIPADRVGRRFDQGRLDAVWVGDVTYLRTWEGWLYLATSSTRTPGGSSAGPSPTTCGPAWSPTPWRWRSSSEATRSRG